MTMKLDFTKLKITRVVKVTEQAVRVQLTNQHDDMEIWVPRSNLSYRADKAVDKNPSEITEIEIADWWLRENRL